MRTDGLPLIGCFAQWQGHRDGEVMPVNATLYGKKLLNRYSAKERKN